jgi:hypothetical protein
MNKQICPTGTVVMLNSSQPVYGVLINRSLWLEKATRENPREVDAFLQGEEERGEGKMLPLLFLGCIINDKLIKVGGEFIERDYLQKYGYSNIENARIITGGVSQLLDIIYQIQQFTRGSIKYIEGAFYEIKILEMYMNGDYDINSFEFTSKHRVLIRLFEQALPGLAGKKSRRV